MAQNSDNQPIDDVLAECCERLFCDYGIDVQARSRHELPPTEKLALCGVMGFVGKQMRGAVVLASTAEPLEQTNPGNRDSQRDWICELSNQLVGRIKNVLLRRGVEIHLATPTALRGVSLGPSPSRVRAPQVFAADTGFVCVWIDCEFVEGFELPRAALNEVAPPLTEGETLLF